MPARPSQQQVLWNRTTAFTNDNKCSTKHYTCLELLKDFREALISSRLLNS